jgi:hypothetical protein
VVGWIATSGAKNEIVGMDDVLSYHPFLKGDDSMIVYEREHNFVMITQHDHAELSSQIAKHWKKDYFMGEELKEHVVYGIREHDRAWIDLDDTPIWNDKNQVPFSFMDFPAKPKLYFYKKGIDEVETKDDYAALLCSLHYESFFRGANHHEDIVRFSNGEKERQYSIKKRLNIHRPEVLKFHFDLLQFCDDLSLYVCLQEPGTKKEDEISWFKGGFQQLFPFTHHKKIMAHWIDKQSISLNPFPLEEKVELTIRIKEVEKRKIAELGIGDAYKETPFTVRKVRFI